MKRLGSINEMSREFLKLEQDLNLFFQKIDGILYWERIRFRVYTRIYESTAGGETLSIKSRRKKSRLRFYISSLINVLRNPFLSRKKDILFVGHPRRVLYNDGSWSDLYTDPIIESLNRSYVSIEPDFNLSHKEPSRTANLKYLDFIIFLSDIQNKLGISKIKITKRENSVIEQIQSEIHRRFNINLNIRRLVLLNLRQRKASLPLYLALLKRISPKIIVVAVGYGKEDLIEAAKILNIPVAELQHGVIYPMHLGYSFSGEHVTKLTFPDYLLVFGKYWASVADYPITQDKIVSVGYPHMDIEKRKLSANIKKNQILVISQGGLGNAISKFAVELSQLVGEEYNIVYKLHPRETEGWKKRYPELVDTNVTIINRRDTSLYQLFSESRIQIGVSSTALYEGLAFGLQTFLIDAPSVEFFDNLIASGFAHKVSNPNEVLIHISKETKSTDMDVESIFKSDAVPNILEFLNQF